MPEVSLPGRTGPTPRSAVQSEVLLAVGRLLDSGERYTTLSVQRICREAGVARSAFYVNFDDKTDVLLRLVETAAADIGAIAGTWIESRPTLGLEALVDAQEAAIGAFRTHAALLRAYAEAAGYDDAVARVWQQRLDAVVAVFAGRLREAQAEGSVRAGLDPDTAARFVVLGAERLLRDHVAHPGGAGDREVAARTGELIWAMLRAGTGGAGA